MPNIRKTQLNIIPFIMLGAILAESFEHSNIAKKLKGDFSLVQVDSVTKRIKRFFTNKLFDPYVFYDHIIRFIINTYKKSILIKTSILFLITCFRMITLLYL